MISRYDKWGLSDFLAMLWFILVIVGSIAAVYAIFPKDVEGAELAPLHLCPSGRVLAVSIDDVPGHIVIHCDLNGDQATDMMYASPIAATDGSRFPKECQEHFSMQTDKPDSMVLTTGAKGFRLRYFLPLGWTMQRSYQGDWEATKDYK